MRFIFLSIKSKKEIANFKHFQFQGYLGFKMCIEGNGKWRVYSKCAEILAALIQQKCKGCKE